METTPDQNAGATASFEYDRITVERFREAFPRARWDDTQKAWIVPGKTAERRLARWRDLEASRADIYADAKGRDAFEFDPIESCYLEIGLDLIVRTPYSKTVVDELRQVPFARWDAADHVWRIPFRAYEELKRRWLSIQAAAERNEPEERQRRREEAKGTEASLEAQRRTAERRRKRYPLPVDELPPLEHPVSTATYGIVSFVETMGEMPEQSDLESLYPDVAATRDMLWATWRSPTLEELVKTWPSRRQPTNQQMARGWWFSTKAELVEARRQAKGRERRSGNG